MSAHASVAGLPRIVSLLPSATEWVCAVGAEAGLVGVSHECDFPPSVADLPALTKARVLDEGSSRAIDRDVRRNVHDALSVYTVDGDRLGALQPDVIVTQDLCEVCAVSLDDVRAAVARIAGAGSCDIVSLRPTRLGEVLDDCIRVAEAVGTAARGLEVRQGLRARIDAIRAQTRDVARPPRTVTLEWIEPAMLGGTWMPDVIEAAGGVAVGVEHGAPAPTVTPQALGDLEPDLVVVKACGFSIERTLRERDTLLGSTLSALDPEVPVYVTDGNAYFNRPGPRIVESIEIMAAILHPAKFPSFAKAHESAIVRLR